VLTERYGLYWKRTTAAAAGQQLLFRLNEESNIFTRRLFSASHYKFPYIARSLFIAKEEVIPGWQCANRPSYNIYSTRPV